ncbi:MAG: hypothetical protein QQN63_00245 [Nitrosopumilus sp.]
MITYGFTEKAAVRVMLIENNRMQKAITYNIKCEKALVNTLQIVARHAHMSKETCMQIFEDYMKGNVDE